MPRPLVIACLAPIGLLAAPALSQQFQQTSSTNLPQPDPAEYTNYIGTGDLDGDGDLDLVFANGGNFSSPGTPQQLRAYLNDGSGVFTDASADLFAGIVGRIRGVALGDADGDGDLDVLTAEDFGAQSRLLINHGKTGFVDETADRLPAMLMSSSRAQFGDLDNDGDLDVYINNGGLTSRFGCGQNRIWINDGTGVFTDETVGRHPMGNTCQPMDVILGDLDGDYDLDVRTGTRGGSNVSRTYMNDGTGRFVDVTADGPSDGNTYSYDLGDIDGDGDLDMIGANAGSSNRELLARNDGSMLFSDVSSRIQPNTTGDDNDSKFLDIDADGDLDLVIAALYQSREKIYRNNAGIFQLESSIISNANDATLDVAAADFDGDGDYDLVTAQGESGSFVNRFYTNTGVADARPPRVRAERVCGFLVDGAIVVRASVADHVTNDRGFLGQAVDILWSVDGGDEQSMPMTHMGHDLWRAEIPAESGQVVTYRVVAVDQPGNQGMSQPAVAEATLGDPRADLDGDCTIGFEDLLALLAAWGPCPGCDEDLDRSGAVDFDDVIFLLAQWS